MEGHVIESSRGKEILIVESASFKKAKVLKSGETFWRCIKQSCNAKVFTVGAEKLITRCDLQHCHDKDIKKLNRQVINSYSKRKAAEETGERPSKLIHSVIKNNVCNVNYLSLRDINDIRNNVYYNRRKTQPPLPRSIEEVIDTLKKMDVSTIKNENFLFINDDSNKIVVFSCLSNIRFLCNSEKIYLDGTFKCCTIFFFCKCSLYIF